ncbi:hypothetical protein LXA43DRAFT_854952, partial [Ganoderma leucocontextum]
YSFTATELLRSLSISIQAVAILRQLSMLQRADEAETVTTHYHAPLRAYMALCIPDWIFRYDKIDVIAVSSGLVQSALYLDFFYVYFTKCV